MATYGDCDFPADRQWSGRNSDGRCYIAVPAAMRLALPEADPGIYLTMSLSITFPFNVLINIGLISAFAVMLTGGNGAMP